MQFFLFVVSINSVQKLASVSFASEETEKCNSLMTFTNCYLNMKIYTLMEDDEASADEEFSN